MSGSIGYQEIKLKVPNLFKSKERRPCTIYQDVVFDNPARVSYITFRNYYSYTVRIDYQEKSGSDKNSFKTLVKNRKLMKDPHYEDDSQEYHVVDLTKVDSPPLVTRIRFYLKQPSPNWRKIGISEVKCYTLIWKKNQKLEFVSMEVSSENRSKALEGSTGEKSKGGKLFYIDPEEYEKNIRWFVGSMLFSDLKKLRKYNSNSLQSEEHALEQNFYHSDSFEEITSLVIGEN